MMQHHVLISAISNNPDKETADMAGFVDIFPFPILLFF
jgi:hypothetical protein